MLFANTLGEHTLRMRVTSSSYLNDSQGNDESIWAFPDGLPCFGLIIIRYSTPRLITELPPFAILAGRKTERWEQYKTERQI